MVQLWFGIRVKDLPVWVFVRYEWFYSQFQFDLTFLLNVHLKAKCDFIFHFCTIPMEGKIIGYFFGWFASNVHYKTNLLIITTILFLFCGRQGCFPSRKRKKKILPLPCTIANNGVCGNNVVQKWFSFWSLRVSVEERGSLPLSAPPPQYHAFNWILHSKRPPIDSFTWIHA